MHQLNQEENNPLMEIARLQKKQRSLFRGFVLSEIVICSAALLVVFLKLNFIVTCALMFLAILVLVIHFLMNESIVKKQVRQGQDTQAILQEQLREVQSRTRGIENQQE